MISACMTLTIKILLSDEQLLINFTLPYNCANTHDKRYPVFGISICMSLFNILANNFSENICILLAVIIML